jgi:hypothetical protein
MGIWLLIWAEAATETFTAEVVEVIDYSEIVIFDAFNGSYLSRQDYRGLSLSQDQEPSKWRLEFFEQINRS